MRKLWLFVLFVALAFVGSARGVWAFTGDTFAWNEGPLGAALPLPRSVAFLTLLVPGSIMSFYVLPGASIGSALAWLLARRATSARAVAGGAILVAATAFVVPISILLVLLILAGPQN